MKILCDTREQAPYTFDRYQGVTVERAALQTCDYSLAGLHVHWCGGRAGGEVHGLFPPPKVPCGTRRAGLRR